MTLSILILPTVLVLAVLVPACVSLPERFGLCAADDWLAAWQNNIHGILSPFVKVPRSIPRQIHESLRSLPWMARGYSPGYVEMPPTLR